jgi:hypothetical protein
VEIHPDGRRLASRLSSSWEVTRKIPPARRHAAGFFPLRTLAEATLSFLLRHHVFHQGTHARSRDFQEWQGQNCLATFGVDNQLAPEPNSALGANSGNGSVPALNGCTFCELYLHRSPLWHISESNAPVLQLKYPSWTNDSIRRPDAEQRHRDAKCIQSRVRSNGQSQSTKDKRETRNQAGQQPPFMDYYLLRVGH